MTAQITPTKNGPYLVEGLIELVDSNGKRIPVNGDEVYLCRCGLSATKPFCDGAHNAARFNAA